MRIATAIVFVAALNAAIISGATAQESKPVPKDSVRVSIPGCSKNYIFVVGHSNTDQPGGAVVPEGMRLRLNAPKATMAEIKAHEGSAIEITGLIKRGQLKPDGVNVGGGVRIRPGPETTGSTTGISPVVSQIQIDVEGWHPIVGDCPTR